MSGVRTIAEPGVVEIPRVKGSRFIGWVSPIADEPAADAFLDVVRAAHPDASHHCWAWRMSADAYRSSDDGEPRGTAGDPILKRLVGDDLVDVMVVVVRYFGGTKLGMGGLVRAYGEAATAVLAASTIVTRVRRARLRVRLAYDHTAALQAVLAAHRLELMHPAYGEDVRGELWVAKADVAVVTTALTERSAGSIVVEQDGEVALTA